MGSNRPLEFIFSLNTLSVAAKQFWEAYGGNRIFALKGGMGTGKTTFIHALADYLGVQDPVSSPTYSIINHYVTSGKNNFYHLDLYRLSGLQEALDLGVEEILYGDGIIFIEWPEIMISLLPAETLWLEITSVASNERRLKVIEAG